MPSQRDEILQEEAQFADEQYARHGGDFEINPVMFKKYAQPGRWWDWRERSARLMGDLDQKKVLDFACGMGEESVYFAKLGAQVSAIDISSTGVEMTRQRAAHNGLGGRISARVMTVDPTDFPDQSFEVIHGLGILHHVGVEPGLLEVKRLLMSGGVGVFLEPMGNSSFLEKIKYRWLGKKLDLEATDHERPITFAELEPLKDQFQALELYPYHLFFRVRRFLPVALHQPLRKMDYYLLKLLPPLRHFAGAVVIKVQAA